MALVTFLLAKELWPAAGAIAHGQTVLWWQVGVATVIGLGVGRQDRFLGPQNLAGDSARHPHLGVATAAQREECASNALQAHTFPR